MNKDLFNTAKTVQVPVIDCVNSAGGVAYQLSAHHALAKYACTSCLNGTFYTSAKTQLDTVKELLSQCEPEFIGQVALYAHRNLYYYSRF